MTSSKNKPYQNEYGVYTRVPGQMYATYQADMAVIEASGALAFYRCVSGSDGSIKQELIHAYGPQAWVRMEKSNRA